MKDLFTQMYRAEQAKGNIPIFVIYHNTIEFGDKYCLRMQTTQRSAGHAIVPSEQYALADSLEGIRDCIPDDCVFIPRHPEDDIVIVETWI